MSTHQPSRDHLLNNLLHELRENSTATILFHQAVATRLGLNPTDHKCLEVIFKHQPITAGQLSEYTGLTTGTVTGVLDRLEKAGFASRVKDPQDKRRVIIRVHQTKAEREIMPLFSAFGNEMNKVLARYEEGELQIIYDFIKDCNRVLKSAPVELEG